MKTFTGIFAAIIILLLISCVSNEKFVYGPTVTVDELETIEIIDSVETIFETTLRLSNNDKVLLERTYYELLKAARKKYTGEIDIKNIVLEKRYSNKNLLLLIPMFFNNHFLMTYTNIYARGEVIRYKSLYMPLKRHIQSR